MAYIRINMISPNQIKGPTNPGNTALTKIADNSRIMPIAINRPGLR